MTGRRATGSAAGAERAPRWLILTFVALLAGVIVVWSTLAHAVVTQVRYTGPGQEEIDARREAVREAPRNPGALLALAYAYQQAGRYDDALFTYEAVLEVLPIETAALYNKGVILLELGDSAAAEEALRSALEVNPGHALSAAALAGHFASQREYESVLEVVLPALEASPSAADLHYLAGAALENLGNPDQAEEHYRLALAYYPDLREAREALERLGVAP
ncbi:MAG: tetratricopeptide repeat protein [Coriobacteriia bacterium]|nr:tetratricopeptide repeat protein [Coriobacteriia bacterium]